MDGWIWFAAGAAFGAVVWGLAAALWRRRARGEADRAAAARFDGGVRKALEALDAGDDYLRQCRNFLIYSGSGKGQEPIENKS